MRTDDEMTASALSFVQKLLNKRLEQEGISTSRPDFYYRCQAMKPSPYPGGSEVRVKVWWLWSRARLAMNSDTGQTMLRAIQKYAEPDSSAELTQEEALEAATAEIQLPPESELESFYHYQYAVGRKAARLQWRHVHRGLRVDGDYMWVVIHPQTRRIIEYAKKWREVSIA